MARGLSRKDREGVAVWRVILDAALATKERADVCRWGEPGQERVGNPKPYDLAAFQASEILEALDAAGYRVTRKPGVKD